MTTVSLSSGGIQNLQFEGGSALGGQTYLLVGSASGTYPGVPYASVFFPLNVDGYFVATATRPTLPPLVGGLGVLSGAGSATAGFQLPRGLPAALVGLEFHHAVAVIDANQSFTHVSNPVAVRLVR